MARAKSGAASKKSSAARKASKPRAAPEGPVKIDAGLKARWEEAISRYRTARTQETAGWDERYEALGDILDSEPPYYLAAGYKTAKAFLKAEVPDQDERTVRTYVRVARYFDPEDEARHGIAKLDLLLRYLEAAGGAPLAPAKIRLDKQRIRLPEGASGRLTPFADTTAEQLRAAARAAAGHSGKMAAKLPPLVKELKGLLSKAKLGSVAVRLRGDRVDLGGIPADKLQELGKTLASAKLTAGG